MATRIAEIQSNSSPNQWWWIEGSSNPADMTTRYTKPHLLGADDVWQSGPAFLSLSREHWPISQSPYEGDLPDRLAVSLVATGKSTDQSICNDIDIERFQSYDKLMRVTTRILSVAEDRSLRSVSKSATTTLLAQAETIWIKHAQLTLMSDWRVRFKRLGPHINDVGILTVGSRIANWLKDNWNKDCYILLPAGHRLTMLLIQKTHAVDHGGVEATLARLQSKFWVPGARRVIKRVKGQCVVCRKLFGKPQHQLMGPGHLGTVTAQSRLLQHRARPVWTIPHQGHHQEKNPNQSLRRFVYVSRIQSMLRRSGGRI